MQALTRVLLLVFLAGMTNAQFAPDVPTEDTTVTAEGNFWMTMSEKVRRGHELVIKVYVIKGDSPVNVTARLVRETWERDENVRTTVDMVTKAVLPRVEETMVLEVGMDVVPLGSNPWEQSFYMEVSGIGADFSFKDRRHMQYDPKGCSIFVQTNKAMYKPSQRVRARIFAVDSNLRPSDETFDVKIEDPEKNIIMRRTGLSDPTGLVEVSLPLADRVTSGEWTIHVIAQCATVEKTFKVDDYVLPKFEAEVIIPPYGVDTDKELQLSVRAKYTFGKPVTDGNVAVTILPLYYQCSYSYYQARAECRGKGENNFITLRGRLDRKGEFHSTVRTKDIVRMVNELNVYERNDLTNMDFVVRAAVIETNTLRTESDEAQIRYYSSPIKASFLEISPAAYKPGMLWTGYIEVRKQDDTKLSVQEAARVQLHLQVQYPRYNRVWQTYPPPRTPPTPKTPPPTDRSTVRPVVRLNTTHLPLPKEDTEDEAGKLSSDSGNSPGHSSGSSMGSSGDELVLDGAEDRNGIAAGSDGWWRTETTYHDVGGIASPLSIDENGWALVTFQVPLDIDPQPDYIQLEATIPGFGRNASAYKSIRPAVSPSSSFIKLEVPPVRVAVGDYLELNAVTSEKIVKLQYQVYAKGMHVKSEYIEVDSPTASFDLGLKLTQEMAPVVTLLVFYVRPDNNEVVTDAVTVNVDASYEKPLSLSFKETVVEPSAEVHLTVRQEAGGQASTIYILSNDLSVNLLASGNDLTQELVQRELLTYTYGSYYPWMRYFAMCGWPYHYGGISAASVLNDAGVVMVTDAFVYAETFQDFMPEENFDGSAAAGASPDISDDSSSNKNHATQPAERVRRNFPETWLWDTYVIAAGSEEIEITLTAPDTITSWPTTAFSLHPSVGLTVGEDTASVTTFRELSVQLNLPLDITRGEEFCFTASVFNYYTQPLPVLVSLSGNAGYDTLYLRKSGNSFEKRTTSGSYNYVNGQLAPDEVDSTMFCVTPTEVGELPVKVSALTTEPGLSDAVERIINVQAEGSLKLKSDAQLLSVGAETTVDLAVLAGGVDGSQFITVNVVGNLLGTILDGIEDLLRRPYGCGEQNMLNFAPNVFLLNFFDATGTLTPERLARGEEYMLIGYQNALGYMQENTGGYSTFRQSTEIPSLWLTAFVTKCFSMARIGLIPEPEVIAKSVGFILGHQDRRGHFVERGKVFNTAMTGGLQGSSTEGVALTAYTMIALLEAREVFTGLDDGLAENISRSLVQADNFLQDNLDILEDPYDICLTAYALNLYGSQAMDASYEKMMEAAKSDGGSTLHWSRKSSTDSDIYWWKYNEDAISVETTAYCLLTMEERALPDNDILPVVRWLTKQRGPYSGFRSTQDTVTGLQALTGLNPSMFHHKGLPYTVSVTYQDASQVTVSQSVEVTEDTEMVVHRMDVPYQESTPSKLTLGVQGSGSSSAGSVFAEVVMGYNVIDSNEEAFFQTSHRLRTEQNGFSMTVSVQTTGEEVAGMTLFEVDIPAGFSPEMDIKSRSISHVEVKGSKLVLYFNTGAIGPRPINTTIMMYVNPGETLTVAETKFYRFSLYYEPDTVVEVGFDLDLDQNFCNKVKTFSICSFLNLPKEE